MKRAQSNGCFNLGGIVRVTRVYGLATVRSESHSIPLGDKILLAGEKIIRFAG